MTVLTDAAAQAYTAAQEAEAAAKEEARKVLRAAARAAVEQVIAPVLWADSGLAFVHVDVGAQVAVVGDGTVHLAAQKVDNGWRVRTASLVDGEWTRGEAVSSLAELGRVLERQ